MSTNLRKFRFPCYIRHLKRCVKLGSNSLILANLFGLYNPRISFCLILQEEKKVWWGKGTSSIKTLASRYKHIWLFHNLN